MSSSGATMFASTAASQSALLISWNARGLGPALLLTRMSGSGQAASSADRPASVVTSPTTGVTSPFATLRMPAAASSSRPRSRPLTTTCTPSAASASAQARPKPLRDAQMMAVRPAIPRSMLVLLRYASGALPVVVLDVQGMHLLGVLEVLVGLEPGGMDAHDRAGIVHPVGVAGHADRADHLARRVADELRAALEEDRAVGQVHDGVHEQRLVLGLLQHQ